MGFEVGRGEVVTLLGRNGAGKTTTLRSIMGLLRKKTGTIRFEGEDTPAACPRRSPGAASPTARRSAASSPASRSRRTSSCRR
jgi:ABC-type branched-subunit amino acid transport system ATPase component